MNVSLSDRVHGADIESLIACVHEGIAELRPMAGPDARPLDQAEFNDAVLHALDILTACVRTNVKRLDALELWLREETERVASLVASRELAGRRDGGPATGSASPQGGAGAGVGYEADLAGLDYVAFEDRFRGPSEEIKRRQSYYLPAFAGLETVVDLGCGRGEFLEMMQAQGATAMGVDSDARMIDVCRAKDLDVLHADAIEFLAGVEDGTIDGVFCAQVVEHLTPARIKVLVDLCAQKLAPGGVAVFETINPNCPTALANFFMDPTHVRPVPARMLGFFLQQAGLEVSDFAFSAPVSGASPGVLEFSSGWPAAVRYYQDYAAIAKKPAQTGANARFERARDEI